MPKRFVSGPKFITFLPNVGGDVVGHLFFPRFLKYQFIRELFEIKSEVVRNGAKISDVSAFPNFM